MKICIYGAGAVGGLMAGWLARAGHAASVVARGANLTAIRTLQSPSERIAAWNRGWPRSPRGSGEINTLEYGSGLYDAA